MLRVRVNRKAIVHTVNFLDAQSFVAIHRMPKWFGFRTQIPAFGGGIFGGSEENNIMIVSQGTTTYLTTNPSATDYKNTSTTPSTDIRIIDRGDDFTMWRDIIILPNKENNANGSAPAAGDAANNMKYFIVLTAKAPAGYEALDENNDLRALPAPAHVYWKGTINGAFTPNKIREVNLTITSPGTTVIPPGPGQEGGLEIEIGAPEDWNSAIEVENKEL